MTSEESTWAQLPEVRLLATLVGDSAAQSVAQAPGGWRTLSEAELEALKLSKKTQASILALQALSQKEVPPLIGELCSASAVARAYQARLGQLEHEVVVVVALDAKNRVVGEFEVSKGGRHGAALTPADVFYPLIRVRASAFLLVHNHPSGSREPSEEDCSMTSSLSAVGELLSLPLIDHLIVTAREYTSFFETGLLPQAP